MSFDEQIHELAKKVNEEPQKILSDYQKRVKELMSVGQSQKQAENIAIRQIKGSYAAQLKSNAKTFIGYFFGITPIRNVNSFVWQQCEEKEAEYKATYKDKWLQEAMKDGFCNNKGEYLYYDGNTTDAQKWMRGKVIAKEKLERQAFGFFKLDSADAPVKFGIVYVRNLSLFEPLPDILKSYRFRATCSNPDAEILSLSTTKVSELKEENESNKINYAKVIETMERLIPNNLYTFAEIYDINAVEVHLRENTKRFAISNVSISKYTITETEGINVDFVELTDVQSDFDNISMAVDKELATNIMDDSIGIAVFQPYFRKKDTIAPSGQLYAFIPDDRFVKPQNVSEIKPDVATPTDFD